MLVSRMNVSQVYKAKVLIVTLSAPSQWPSRFLGKCLPASIHNQALKRLARRLNRRPHFLLPMRRSPETPPQTARAAATRRGPASPGETAQTPPYPTSPPRRNS